MKLLDGAALAAKIKVEHTARSATLIKAGITPKLAIIQVKDDPVINTYVRLKKKYGQDIGAVVEVHRPPQGEAPELIDKLNNDPAVHGIIVQLPLADASQTDKIVNLVAGAKDVDALGKKAEFDPATPNAILRLLSGYDIELNGQKVLLIGRGKLVGAPLEKILESRDVDVTVIDRPTPELSRIAKASDIIITATSSPGVVRASMLKKGAVVVDAGVASEEGKTVGDVAQDVYQRDDITITPTRGGVGPLTVCSLFENLLEAAAKASQQP